MWNFCRGRCPVSSGSKRQTYPHIRCVINDSNESSVNAHVSCDTPEELLTVCRHSGREYHALENGKKGLFLMEKLAVVNEGVPDDITRAAFYFSSCALVGTCICLANRKAAGFR